MLGVSWLWLVDAFAEWLSPVVARLAACGQGDGQTFHRQSSLYTPSRCDERWWAAFRSLRGRSLRGRLQASNRKHGHPPRTRTCVRSSHSLAAPDPNQKGWTGPPSCHDTIGSPFEHLAAPSPPYQAKIAPAMADNVVAITSPTETNYSASTTYTMDRLAGADPRYAAAYAEPPEFFADVFANLQC